MESVKKSCPQKKRLSIKNHVILSYHVLSGLIYIPVNSTTYFVQTVSTRHAVLSHMTRKPQRANTDMIKTYKNMKFSPSFPSEFHEQRLNCLDQCHSWAADLLVTLVFRLGQNALHTLPSSYGSNKERKTRNHKRNNQERKKKQKWVTNWKQNWKRNVSITISEMKYKWIWHQFLKWNTNEIQKTIS